MTYGKKLSNAALGAALVGALAAGSHAAVKIDPKDVKFVDGLLSESKQDPKAAELLTPQMARYGLDSKKIVERKLAKVKATPANVASYGGASSREGMGEKSLSASGVATRAVLEEAGEIVKQARLNAKDAPKKYVAETGGKIVTGIDNVFNEVAVKVQEEINIIRRQLAEMVAIALVINASGNNARQTSNAEQENTVASLDQDRTATPTAIDPGDAEVGAAVEAIIRPELPLSRYGQQVFEDAEKRARSIPKLVMARAEDLDKFRKMADELAREEAKYKKAMKGANEAKTTSEVLNAAIDSLGAHLMMVNGAAQMLVGFIEGPGQTIYDVVSCSQDVYNAARGLQTNIPDEEQLALALRARASNQKAARGVGPMARSFEGMLAYLGSTAPLDQVWPPGGEDRHRPRAHDSQAPDADKAYREMPRQLDKVGDDRQKM